MTPLVSGLLNLAFPAYGGSSDQIQGIEIFPPIPTSMSSDAAALRHVFNQYGGPDHVPNPVPSRPVR
jgi:hypothetical protein